MLSAASVPTVWGSGMHKGRDPDYYATRLRAEREAAATATCDQARASHLELASRYQQLLDACDKPRLVADASAPESVQDGSSERLSAAR